MLRSPQFLWQMQSNIWTRIKAAGMGLYQALYSAGTQRACGYLEFLPIPSLMRRAFIAIAVIAIGGMALSIGAGGN